MDSRPSSRPQDDLGLRAYDLHSGGFRIEGLGGMEVQGFGFRA